jgi:hypothetical protein
MLARIRQTLGARSLPPPVEEPVQPAARKVTSKVAKKAVPATGVKVLATAGKKPARATPSAAAKATAKAKPARAAAKTPPTKPTEG